MKEKLLCFLRQESTKKALKIALCFMFTLYIFAIPALSDIRPFNYLVYVLFFVFSLTTLFYCLFYKPFKLLIYRAFIFVPFLCITSIGTVIYSHAFRLLLTVFLIVISVAVLFMFYLIIGNYKIISICFVIGFSLFAVVFAFYYRSEIIGFLKGNVSRIALDNHFANVNTIGAFLVGLFTFSFFMLLFWKNKWTLLNLPVVLLSFSLGIMTGSRMFVITFLLSLIVLIVFRFKKRPFLLALILGTLIVFLIIVLTLPFFSGIKQRFIDMWNMLSGDAYSSDFSTATRFLWQNYGFYLGSKHFIFGLGVDGFAVFSGTGTYSHANFFELICNVGITGFLAYYLVWALCLKQSFKIQGDLRWLIITLLIASFSKGFFTVDYYSKFNAFIISYALFATYAFCKHEENKNSISYYAIEI